MRITNNMIRSNTMLHIQKNKETANDYFQQYASRKKIQKPSDNPTIAVRALKYRTTLVEINQYLSNCDEAENWMDATEEPLKKADGILDTAETVLRIYLSAECEYGLCRTLSFYWLPHRCASAF